MRRMIIGVIAALVAISYVALGLVAAWSILHYRPYPVDGEFMSEALRTMHDIAELRANADNLAYRKDLVSSDFNQVFPAACIALMVASAVGAGGFTWIASVVFRKKQISNVDSAP